MTTICTTTMIFESKGNAAHDERHVKWDATILKDTPKEFKVSELPRATPEAIAKFFTKPTLHFVCQSIPPFLIFLMVI